jgi:methionine synthase II (cobalamin-independent)
LSRTAELIAANAVREENPSDVEGYNELLTASVVDLVQRQQSLGIDIPNDGEYGHANVRHEHEWRVWEDTKLPEGKVIIPGIVSHATNVVEHPDLVADRIVRFADVVGRENVIASTDCGLGGRAHPQIAFAKLEALGEGARRATKRPW